MCQIRELGINLSEWVRERIDQDLSDIPRTKKMIDDYKFKVEILEARLNSAKQKTEDKKKIPKAELKFLLDCSEAIETNPAFIQGRINLYINRFGKFYKISKKEFMDLLFEAENQHRENVAVQNKTNKILVKSPVVK